MAANIIWHKITSLSLKSQYNYTPHVSQWLDGGGAWRVRMFRVAAVHLSLCGVCGISATTPVC